MNLIEVIILAVVQGLTEFIPVSSSGHLVIFEKILNTNQSTTFDIVLHGGTLLSLFVFYRKRIHDYFFKKRQDDVSISNLIIISIPIIIFGGVITIINKLNDNAADEFIKNTYLVILNLVFGGFLFLIIDAFVKNKGKKLSQITKKDALIIGIFQSLSALRGSSRSGSTITGAVFSGFSQKQATDLAFFAGIPVISIAFGFEILQIILDYSLEIPISYLIVGFIVSFLSGLVAIEIMLKTIDKLGLKFFGIYRIILGIIVYFVLAV